MSGEADPTPAGREGSSLLESPLKPTFWMTQSFGPWRSQMSQKYAGPKIIISSLLWVSLCNSCFSFLCSLSISLFLSCLSLSLSPPIFLSLALKNITFPDLGSCSMLGQVQGPAPYVLRVSSPQPHSFHLHRSGKLRLRETGVLPEDTQPGAGRAITAQTTVHCPVQGCPSSCGCWEENPQLKLCPGQGSCPWRSARPLANKRSP